MCRHAERVDGGAFRLHVVSIELEQTDEGVSETRVVVDNEEFHDPFRTRSEW